jgi:hypothetical protein
VSTLARVPQCAKHGPMAVVPGGGRTELSRWYGVWYECTSAWSRCGNTALIASSELLAQLAEQQAKAASQSMTLPGLENAT